MKHQHFMRQALELAKNGLYSTQPNPRVGCVLVKNGRVIGHGAHLKAGEAHAEIHALKQAGKQAQGATAYVTLEPCSHIGRTGACVDALIQAGIKQVVAASYDPNPQVAGQGFKKLKAAGIEVLIENPNSELSMQAQVLNAGFFMRHNKQRPLVRLKLAMSLDGRTAMASGESKWITSTLARQDVQNLRAQSCAVLSTAQSVIADNAAMSVRFEEAKLNISKHLHRQPLRILLDGQQRIRANSRFMQQAGDILIVSRQAQLNAALTRPSTLGQLSHYQQSGEDLSPLLEYLAQQHINEILVEAGATLAGSLIKQRLVDELIVYCAPVLLGNLAQALVELPLSKMQEKVRWQFSSVEQIDTDLKLSLTPV